MYKYRGGGLWRILGSRHGDGGTSQSVRVSFVSSPPKAQTLIPTFRSTLVFPLSLSRSFFLLSCPLSIINSLHLFSSSLFSLILSATLPSFFFFVSCSIGSSVDLTLVFSLFPPFSSSFVLVPYHSFPAWRCRTFWLASLLLFISFPAARFRKGLCSILLSSKTRGGWDCSFCLPLLSVYLPIHSPSPWSWGTVFTLHSFYFLFYLTLFISFHFILFSSTVYDLSAWFTPSFHFPSANL